MSQIAVQEVDYEQLTKLQKIALFMIIVGPEAAAELFKHFEDSEIEIISREIANFQIIDSNLQKKVVDEFSGIISGSLGVVVGGANFAKKALELAKGAFKAANLVSRLSPAGSFLEVIKEISEMEPRQIFNLIRYEQPQTIAFVVSYLDLEKASTVISMVSPELRDEVIERIGSMESTCLEHVDKVVKTLRQHFNIDQRLTMHRSGGVRPVAELLNLMDKGISKSLLAKIEERNPALGMAISRKMFSFEDLLRLEARDLQRVTREIEMSDLVISIKSANSALQKAIFASVSKRAAETIKEEMQMLGPVRLKDVEAAQDRIIQVVRRLEEEEEITIDHGGDNRVLE